MDNRVAECEYKFKNGDKVYVQNSYDLDVAVVVTFGKGKSIKVRYPNGYESRVLKTKIAHPDEKIAVVETITLAGKYSYWLDRSHYTKYHFAAKNWPFQVRVHEDSPGVENVAINQSTFSVRSLANREVSRQGVKDVLSGMSGGMADYLKSAFKL